MPEPKTDRKAERDLLLREIAAEYVQTAAWTGKAEMSGGVHAALSGVPREKFVPEVEAYLAYANMPLPIGHGQTISQPYMVAIMTDLLELSSSSVVLEIGTGCGYQAAVLAGLAKAVYTVEYVPELARAAAERLARLGYANVTVRTGDGFEGWPEHAPYDGIIVTCAASAVPPPLIEQLKAGGRIVIPIGAPFSFQDLVLVTKDADGGIHEKTLFPVAFVPLVHAAH
ncbi:MAG: protein-L-isoaspartate(D-aspartate) O-methyltransferase [Alphaproteobacteria bacterium]